MGVKHVQRRILLGHVAHHGQKYGVLEYIGVVAGVEGVSVTEHPL
jgi:hypothetical protein